MLAAFSTGKPAILEREVVTYLERAEPWLVASAAS
jgi:hypothetical protein